jgi:hypothetical protein
MKTIVSLAGLGLVLAWSSPVFAETAQEKMLAEMENCAVCKYMAENPELMKETTWETHKIDNGMLCLTTVPKEMKKEFDAASAKMMQAIAKLEADSAKAKETKLCSFCQSMGELHKLHAKMQHIDTQTGAIHMVTSDDPAIVKKIHAFADKAIAEQKKMQQQEERTASLR